MSAKFPRGGGEQDLFLARSLYVMHVLDTYKLNESDDKNLSKKGNVDFLNAQGQHTL